MEVRKAGGKGHAMKFTSKHKILEPKVNNFKAKFRKKI